MTRYGKPPRPLIVEAAGGDPVIESCGIVAGDQLYCDPEQPGDETDLVLVLVGRGMLVCLMGQQPAGSEIVGPIVWIVRGFEPDGRKWESAPLEP